MVNKIKLRLTEFMLILIVGVITVITNPPLPLLAIPFLIIISMRNIFITLEDA